jgi:hypothetical protein
VSEEIEEAFARWADLHSAAWALIFSFELCHDPITAVRITLVGSVDHEG